MLSVFNIIFTKQYQFCHLLFSDDNAVCYVLPVLWMTSCLLITAQGKGNASRAYTQIDSPGSAPGAKSDALLEMD